PATTPKEVSTWRHVSAPTQCKRTAKPIPHTALMAVRAPAQQPFSLSHEMARTRACICLQRDRCARLRRGRVGRRSADKIQTRPGYLGSYPARLDAPNE